MRPPKVPVKTEKGNYNEIELHRFYQRLYKNLRRNISFGNDGATPDNIDGAWARVLDSGAANVDFPVIHNLKRVPVAYDVKGMSGAAIVYTGVTPWTNTKIYLRCNLAHIELLLFIH